MNKNKVFETLSDVEMVECWADAQSDGLSVDIKKAIEADESTISNEPGRKLVEKWRSRADRFQRLLRHARYDRSVEMRRADELQSKIEDLQALNNAQSETIRALCNKLRQISEISGE